LSAPIRAVASAFSIYGEFLGAAPYGAGHINDTYCAEFCQGGTAVRYILQRINDKVFKHPAALMENIQRVTLHIAAKAAAEVDPSRRGLTLILARDGRCWHQDNSGNFWRAYIFIEKARTLQTVDSESQAYEAARAFGRFQHWLADLPAPQPDGYADHMGIHEQKQPGLFHVGIPVPLGVVQAEQLRAIAGLAMEAGADVRLTKQQNAILANVPEARVEGVVETLAEIGFPVDANPLRAAAIACTGEPHCNFSVTETKSRMDGLVQMLEARFGPTIDGLRLHLDGCPHACAHHWVGDLGFQGTTVRDAEGKRHQAYDVFLRGSLDRPAAIARPVFKRVPSEELDAAVSGLVAGWVGARAADETFRSFCDRSTDDELGRLAGREPARTRQKETA